MLNQLSERKIAVHLQLTYSQLTAPARIARELTKLDPATRPGYFRLWLPTSQSGTASAVLMSEGEKRHFC